MAPTPRSLSSDALRLPRTQCPLHSPKHPTVICKICHYSKCIPLVFCNHMRSNLWKFTCTGVGVSAFPESPTKRSSFNRYLGSTCVEVSTLFHAEDVKTT